MIHSISNFNTKVCCYVTTNFGVKIGDRVDHAINYLGDNYRKDKVGKGFVKVSLFND
jgi:hypothetical protein